LFVFLSVLPVGTGKDVRAVFPVFAFSLVFYRFSAARAFKQAFYPKALFIPKSPTKRHAPLSFDSKGDTCLFFMIM
jgi:hypothetical protein